MHVASSEIIAWHDIDAIYASGNREQLQKLSSIRRKAGVATISRLLRTINSDALRNRAKVLRDEKNCTVTLPSADEAYYNFDIVGGCNYHASIEFEDGVTWLARFRLPNHNAPQLDERNFDRRSEYATYRFLATTAVPVPAVYDVADDEDSANPVGAGYLLLEKLPGKPATWYDATQAQKDSFSRQLADIFISLEKFPFDKLGRLQLAAETRLPEPGPAFFEYDSRGNITPLGPFAHSKDHYAALIEQRIALISSGEVAISAPLDTYLVCKSLLDNLPIDDNGPFYLRHMDSRDANFLVDDDYNITGIIDWELAVLAPKHSAFQAPLLMYDLGDVYDECVSTPSLDEQRFVQILSDEKGRHDIAACAVRKFYFRLEQCIETDPHDPNFTSVFEGWWRLVKGVGTFEWGAWRKDALNEYGDPGLGGVQSVNRREHH
ncbi:MAG: hypothetical protein M4579_005774 [Chaenotheca gracillima]|nr:MAG: hypothetical protein M4579_005774 [Chaenotheca gracillima]